MVNWSDVAVAAGTSFLDRRDTRLVAEHKAKLADAKAEREFQSWLKKEQYKLGWGEEERDELRIHERAKLIEKREYQAGRTEDERKHQARVRKKTRGLDWDEYLTKFDMKSIEWLRQKKIEWAENRKDKDQEREYAWTNWERQQLWHDKTWLHRQRILWNHEKKVKGEDAVASWDDWLKKRRYNWETFKNQEDHKFVNKTIYEKARDLVQSKRTSIKFLHSLVENGRISKKDVPTLLTELEGLGVKISPIDQKLLKYRNAIEPDVKAQVAILKDIQTGLSRNKIFFNPYPTLEDFKGSFSDQAWGKVFEKRTKENVYNQLMRGVANAEAVEVTQAKIEKGKKQLTFPNLKKGLWVMSPEEFQSKSVAIQNGILRTSSAKSSINTADSAIASFLKDNSNKLTNGDDLNPLFAYIEQMNGVYNSLLQPSLPATDPNQTIAASMDFWPQTSDVLEKMKIGPNALTTGKAIKKQEEKTDQQKHQGEIAAISNVKQKARTPTTVQPQNMLTEPTLNQDLIAVPTDAKGRPNLKKINYDALDHEMTDAEVFAVDPEQFDKAVNQVAEGMANKSANKKDPERYAQAISIAKASLKKKYEISFLQRDLSETMQRYRNDPKRSAHILNTQQFQNQLMRMQDLDDTFKPIRALEEAIFLATPSHIVKRNSRGGVKGYVPITSGSAGQGLKTHLYGAMVKGPNKNLIYKQHTTPALNPQVTFRNISGATVVIENMLGEIKRYQKVTDGQAFTGQIAGFDLMIMQLSESVHYGVKYLTNHLHGEALITRFDGTKGKMFGGSKANQRQNSIDHFKSTVDGLTTERSSIINKYGKERDPAEKARLGILANLNSMKIRFAYQLSSMLQGEGTGGGRTISDMDFQNAMIAISGTPTESLAKLNSLLREFTDKKDRMKTAMHYDRYGKLPAIDAATASLRGRINQKKADRFYALSTAHLQPKVPTAGLLSNDPEWDTRFGESISQIETGYPLLEKADKERRASEIKMITGLTKEIFIKSEVLKPLAKRILENPKLTAHGVITNMSDKHGVFAQFAKEIAPLRESFIMSLAPAYNEKSLVDMRRLSKLRYNEKTGDLSVGGEGDPVSLFERHVLTLRNKNYDEGLKNEMASYILNLERKALLSALLAVIANESI